MKNLFSNLGEPVVKRESNDDEQDGRQHEDGLGHELASGRAQEEGEDGRHCAGVDD